MQAPGGLSPEMNGYCYRVNPEPVQPEMGVHEPKLTLDNYDAPGCENQRHILTSPRSLRVGLACGG